MIRLAAQTDAVLMEALVGLFTSYPFSSLYILLPYLIFASSFPFSFNCASSALQGKLGSVDRSEIASACMVGLEGGEAWFHLPHI